MEPSRSCWERPLVVALVIALLVALHAASLGWGFFADDFGQRLVLEHPEQGGTMKRWNLYDFGDAASVRAEFPDDAIFPWWIDPAWKARFFRPVSSLVLWLDHEVFGRFAPGHHAAGLAWHALYLVLAWRLFRALGLGPGVALLALAVLGAEDGSVTTVGWVANRNSVVEGVFAAGALLLAVHGRAHGRRASLLGALACGVLAAGSKESGVAALLGCALVLGTARLRGARVAGALAALLAAAHLAFLLLAGYGARSEFYPTPWGMPASWAQHLAGMLSAGALGTLSPFPVDALLLVPGGYWPMVTLCALGVALLARPWWRALRTLELGPHLAAFALLSVLAQASAPPSDRLLYVPALGLAPATAVLLARWIRAGRRGARVLGWTLAALAVPLSALVLVARGRFMGGVAEDLRDVFLEAELQRDPPARRDVLVLQSPSVLASLSPLATWRWLTGDWHTRFHVLQFARRPLAWTRIDAHTFELESLGQPFLELLFERVFLAGTPRAPGPLPPGPALVAELLDVDPVRRVRFHLDEPLEAERWEFLVWRDGRWRAVAPPALGVRAVIDASEPLRPHMP
jgi:hypothetical protein